MQQETWICSMGTEMEHGHGNAAWARTCCMSNSYPSCMSMSILHGCLCCTAACPFCISILHVYAHTAFPCLCMLHVHVYGECPGPCCKSMSMLLSMSMLQVHGRAVCSCPCSRDIDMQHRHRHAAWARTRNMYCDMQHGHERAA
jgi:hypothetical protein